MAEGQGRSPKQKLKLLYLKKFFEEKTDENHVAKMSQITDYLASVGIPAERKSIYTDLEQLELFGFKVEKDDSGKAYQLSKRTFDYSEVKLIADTIASSKFVPESKSMALIKKLGTLCSDYQRQQINSEIRVIGRAKSMNESEFKPIDFIQSAMRDNTTVTFKYFHFNLEKKREFSRNGDRYEVSPWSLLYDNDNYYLLAYVNGEFRTYRVDRMASLGQGLKEREGKEEFDKIDIAAYTKSTFSMFSGEQEKVDMVFHNRMLDAVIDKFGKDVWLIKEDEWHFKATATVSISPQFFAWIFGLGGYAKIVGPESVVKQMKEMLENVSDKYK